MHGTHLTCGSLLLALAVAGQGLGAPPDRAGGEPSGVCIGVLGAVARPGAYEFQADRVDLEAVLQAAGGVREDAAETVRVIRDGQVRFTGARSREKSLALRANDFVVVERLSPSGAARSNAFLPRELRPGEQLAQERSSQGIHVGLANVIGRPVVSEIPRDRATNLDILEALNQPESILPSVRLIQPMNTYETTSFPGALPADSVLIFDRSLIEANRLRPFPPPHRVAPPAASGPLILAVSQSETPVEPEVNFPGPAFAEAGERFDAPGGGPVDEVSVVEVTSVDESIAPAPEEARSGRDEAPEQAMIDWRLAVLAVLAIAGLAGSLRIRRAPRTRPRVQGRLEPVMLPIIEAPEKTRLLDALIEDLLPVFEEPCRLPAVLEFYGRPAGAARTDVPQSLVAVEVGPPHFIHARQAVAGRAAETSHSEGTAQVDGPNRRADASHAFETAHRPHSAPQADGMPSVLDRILTRLDKEARA